MGHMIAPLANRLPLSRDWRSRWIDTHAAPYFILEDATIRRLITKRLGKNALIERIDIERDAQELRVGIYSAKPGVIIGRGGQGISGLRSELERSLQSLRDRRSSALIRTRSRRTTIPTSFKLDVYELKDGDRRSAIIAQTIAVQLERRMAHRRAANQAIERALGRGVLGIKIRLAGRLGGVEISRTESYSKGAMPMSTLNQQIDHAQATAVTTYGTIGVSVWVYRGEGLAAGAEPLPSPRSR
jgi:small subunit ribosomal protein S3